MDKDPVKESVYYVCPKCGHVVERDQVKWESPYGVNRGYSRVLCPQCQALLDYRDSSD
jgi:predicted RNA-binding Zn-ribbon protein involved in translation (DUF1610 family)